MPGTRGSAGTMGPASGSPTSSSEQVTRPAFAASGAPPTAAGAPFMILAREQANGGAETWVVRDWEPEMAAYFATIGAALNDVIDLDLEEGFVELLRTFRGPPS